MQHISREFINNRKAVLVVEDVSANAMHTVFCLEVEARMDKVVSCGTGVEIAKNWRITYWYLSYLYLVLEARVITSGNEMTFIYAAR